MIEIGQYKKVLEEGLLLDHYVLLCNLRDGNEIIKSKRIQGFTNLLCKKGYIEDGALTNKALLLIEHQPIVVIKRSEEVLQVDEPEATNDKAKFDYGGWIIALHKKCEVIIIKATGKRQARDKIEGKSYPFLPNSTDLGKVILRVVHSYKLKDFSKIEKTILAYVNTCAKKGKWFPLLGYYIMKGTTSTMVTDMDDIEEEAENDNDSIVNI